jgi:sulfite reductase (NADPH) flavoprotein alpha-component
MDARQAHWISAYFEGFGAGRTLSGEIVTGRTDVSRRLTILFGSETGNAIELAERLHEQANQADITATLTDMSDYKVRNLASEQDMLIIVSTYGEGDPPQPATSFFEFIEGRKASSLEQVRFAVLALGDSSYEYFCEAGKRLDRRFAELDAKRLINRIDCDVDYDRQAEAWCESVIALLSGNGDPKRQSGEAAIGKAHRSPSLQHDKRNPFIATVIENIPIVGRGSSKETRHIELSLAESGLSYEPGDAIGIIPQNDLSVVNKVLDALGFEAAQTLDLDGETVAIGEVLRARFEITTATPRFLETWALLTEASELAHLLPQDRTGERARFLHNHHIIDIVRRFPCAGVAPKDIIAGLRPIQPRLYSLASSFVAAPNEAHITVSPVRYQLDDEQRSGVSSGQLVDRSEADTTLPVYIQSNPHFRLPSDGAPIIMIGAGTGVAPYRAFLQQREVDGGAGNSWLFFGDRNFRTDFLYQAEWQGWLKDGTLSKMDVAFSRDTIEKVYVQHRLLEHGKELFGWLEDGAHIYVCGDAAKLAPDVHEALICIVASETRTGREAAEDYLRGIQNDHRYQRDVY